MVSIYELAWLARLKMDTKQAQHVAKTGVKYLIKRLILKNPAFIGGAIGGSIGLVVGTFSANTIMKWLKKRLRKEDHTETNDVKIQKSSKVVGASKVIGNLGVHTMGALGGMFVGASAGGFVASWAAFAFNIFSTGRTVVRGYKTVMKYDTKIAPTTSVTVEPVK